MIGELTAPSAFSAALAQLQQVPLGAFVLGRDGCDHQGHLLRQRWRLRQLLPMGFRDFLAATRPDLALPQLLSTLMERTTSPLDQQKTAAVAGYGSREAFGLRLQRLVNSHALLRCRHRLDDGRSLARLAAQCPEPWLSQANDARLE